MADDLQKSQIAKEAWLKEKSSKDHDPQKKLREYYMQEEKYKMSKEGNIKQLQEFMRKDENEVKQKLDDLKKLSEKATENERENTLKQAMSKTSDIEGQEKKKAEASAKLKQEDDEKVKKEILEIQKKAQDEDKKLQDQMAPSKQIKTNSTDDFAERWNSELAHRGLQPSDSRFGVNSFIIPELGSFDNSNASVMLLKSSTNNPNETGAANPAKVPKDANNSSPPIIIADVAKFAAILNELRSSPKKYSSILQNKFVGMIDDLGCHKVTLRHYEEGKISFIEARNVLQNLAPLAVLTVDAGLCVAAHLQAKKQAQQRKVFGEGREPQVEENIKNWVQLPTGTEFTDCNISSQSLNYEDLVLNLFANDGDSSRHNRTSLTKEGFSKMGFGIYQRSKNSPIFATVILSGKQAQTRAKYQKSY